MNLRKHQILGATLLAPLLSLTCCGREATKEDAASQGGAPTNRLNVPPAVVNNLGITFEPATRGRLGLWREVPGQLEVPESRRWTLRAPARGRIESVVPRWQAVAKGDEVARLASPELLAAQRAIELAERTLAQASTESAAAKARLAESEAFLHEAESFEQASKSRLSELQAFGQGGNALTGREIIEARGACIAAGRARLDAAIARDDLASRVAGKQLEADQARLMVAESLSALALLTGDSVEALRTGGENGPGWRRVATLVLRTPAAGIVADLLAAQGEIVDADAEVAHVLDTSELRFRGHLPEGDAGTLAAGNRVRLEFPSRRLQAIETRLLAPLPVADADTRMIHVEAVVPNADGRLAQGMSVMAQVLVEESQSEEVLIPLRCAVLDGLETIVFKRDPEDPNVVVRTPVELGRRAAGRVEVLAGVLDGDSVVADGVLQLKQTGLGKAPEGGHFHVDGTWHSDHK